MSFWLASETTGMDEMVWGGVRGSRDLKVRLLPGANLMKRQKLDGAG